MIKPAISLQDLRRKIYIKAKSEKKHKFWGMYVHIYKYETLEEACLIAKDNGGVEGIDGVTFDYIEENGRNKFLLDIQKELREGTYKPNKNRKWEIPKDNGKARKLSIPTIKDRTVQGALKLILEAVFEADFSPNNYGYRPKKSQHYAVAQVRRSILRGMTVVIDIDLSAYFDNVRHHILIEQVAKRFQDADIMRLLKMILKATGSKGVPQGGPLSPLLSNLYLTRIDWMFEKARIQTNKNGYDEINYHRWADDIVILISPYPSKRWIINRAKQRLKEELEKLQVMMNPDKTKMAYLNEKDSFIYLGFEFRKASSKEDKPFVLLKPKKKAIIKLRKKIKETLMNNRFLKMKDIIAKINSIIKGWVNYYRVGHSSKAFSNIKNYVIKLIRRLLERRTRKRGRGFGWKKWSSQYIYGILGLYYDYKIQYLKPPVKQIRMKVNYNQ
jgi:RNA-directed DNA polymerase